MEEEDKENGVRHERTKTMDAARRFPVLLELGTNVLYCFECSKEGHKVRNGIAVMKRDICLFCDFLAWR